MASRRDIAPDRFELNRRQAVEEPPSAAGDPRRYHEPEFVGNASGEQRLRDRDACVDADIAPGLLLEIPGEFGQPAVEHRRAGPVPVEGVEVAMYFVTPLMNVANGWIWLSGQNCAHSV